MCVSQWCTYMLCAHVCVLCVMERLVVVYPERSVKGSPSEATMKGPWPSGQGDPHGPCKLKAQASGVLNCPPLMKAVFPGEAPPGGHLRQHPARTSRKRVATARSSSVSTRLSTNIQKKGCGLLGRGREYCRTRWNWNRNHPADTIGASGSARCRDVGPGPG